MPEERRKRAPGLCIHGALLRERCVYTSIVKDDNNQHERRHNR